MAHELNSQARWLLLNPFKAALAIFLIGLGGGAMAESIFASNLFERFGSLTVALGVLAFGTVAAELLNRAQDGRYARGEDDPTDPVSVSNIRKALQIEALVVFVGTIQWGFGSLMSGNN